MVLVEMHFSPIPLLVLILICNCSPFHGQVIPDPETLIHRIAKGIIVDQDLKLSNDENLSFLLFDLHQYLNNTFYPLLVNFLKNETYSKCTEDIFYFLQNLKSMWAIEMLDSFGKPGSGILQLNTRWLGDYDECLSVYAPPKLNSDSVGDFHGRYCSLQMTFEVKEKELPISIGVCLPDSCNPSPYNGSHNFSGPFGFIDEEINALLNNTVLTCQPISRTLSPGAIVVIFLVSFFILLAVIGTSITIYEHLLKLNTKNETKFGAIAASEKDAEINADLERQSRTGSDDLFVLGSQQNALPVWLEKCKPFFNCFCFITNGEKLLNTTSTEGQLPSLHGIRFLSMTWVMLCHAYAFSFTSIKSQGHAQPVVENWTFQIVLNGFYSVDSFFLLSGFLVAYLFFQEFSKKDGKIPWVYFYVHRYVRLTPVYMIVVAFFSTVVYYLGNGPVWGANEPDINCSKYWWWNVLYINNFQDAKDQCMAWSWYLANDMQFYVISPLFLVPMWRWPKVGFSLLGLFMTASFVANFVLTYHYSLFTGLGNIMLHTKDIKSFLAKWSIFFDRIYTKPYTRIGPYLVGIAVAYFIVKKKQAYNPKLHWVKLFIGWIVAIGVTLACLFGPYHKNLSVVEAGFYNALNRTGFALGLGWVVFVCVIGQGGPVNTFLSWKLFIPLSRLTFCAYLVHPIIEIGYYQSVKTLMDFNNLTIVTIYLGFLVMAYCSAALTSLLFESPLIRLEKVARTMFLSKRPSD